MKIAAVIGLALAVWAFLHLQLILRPQIREVERKLNLPEFQGTAHQRTIQFAFQKLRQSRVRYRVLTFLFGAAALCLFLFS